MCILLEENTQVDLSTDSSGRKTNENCVLSCYWFKNKIVRKENKGFNIWETVYLHLQKVSLLTGELSKGELNLGSLSQKTFTLILFCDSLN